MLVESLRYPLGSRAARDAVAACTALALVGLLLVRAASALWPDWLALLPAAVVVVPAALVGGYLASVLRAPDPDREVPRFSLSTRTLRTGVRVLVVGAVYSIPAAVALVATAFVVLEGGGMLLTLAPTVSLLLTVISSYLLPAALSVAARDGVVSVLTRGRAPFRGLASGSYFFAWTVATSLVVTGWSALAAVGVGTPAAILATVAFVYAHVAAARLLNEGLRNSPWSG